MGSWLDLLLGNDASQSNVPPPPQGFSVVPPPPTGFSMAPPAQSAPDAKLPPTHVQAPDGSIVKFPGDMTDDQIVDVMRRYYGGPNTSQTSQKQPAWANAPRIAALPDGTRLQFPADATDEEITQTVNKHFGAAIQADPIVSAASRGGALVGPNDPAAAMQPSPLIKHIESAVTGEGRMDDPSLPEFTGKDLSHEAALKLTAGLILGTSQQAADIAKNNGVNVYQDTHGNWIAETPNEKGYLNKPGLGERDIGQAMGQAALYSMALSPAGRVAGAIPRALLRTALGAGTSLATDAGLREIGSDQPLSFSRAGLTGAAVLGGEVLSHALGPLADKLGFGTRVVDANGNLTPQAADVLRSLDIDPDHASPELIQALQQQVQRSGMTPAATRAGVAGEFGIPLTRAQATQLPKDAAFEDAALNGAKGDATQNVIRGKMAAQSDAIAAAKNVQAARLAGGQSLAPDPIAAAEQVAEGVRSRAADLSARISDAYGQADPATAQAAVDWNFMQGLPGRARQALNDKNLIVDQQLNPRTMRALQEIDDFVSGKDASLQPGETISGVSLQGLDRLRQRIGSLFTDKMDSADKLRLAAVKSTVDDHIDDAVDNALISGDPSALDALKEARRLRFEYGARFGRPGSSNGTDRIMQRILDENSTPEEVSNWLYGASQVGLKGESVRLAQRLQNVLGTDSPEWQAIREGAWRKAVQMPAGQTPYTPDQVAQRISGFVNGNGRSLAETLYSPDEIAQMQRFASAMRFLKPGGAPDPSRISYGMARMMGNWISNIAGAAGWAQGGPAAGFAAREGIGTAINLANAIRANMAARGAPRALPSTGSALVPSGGAVYGRSRGRPSPAIVQ